MMRTGLDELLKELELELIHMGEACTLAIEKVTKSLKNGDLKQAKKVREADEVIDGMEKDIENLCLKILLEQQPVAKDLRQVSAALKMVTDMERIGDQTADIAEIIISENISEQVEIDTINKMATAAKKMVRDSIKAYVNQDLSLVVRVIEADDEVDLLFVENKKDLIALLLQNNGRNGERALDLIMIAKYLERIADHATNIAEWVEYSITGIHKKGN